ncbi:tail protein X [Paenibacillus macquariensis]|uniref:Phage tail protein n=1 Tax=Paenibacillus macquariensis TaxID=948756 RepID=A0ABY1K744_9BACL|nr:hypothetical protein [Paenibacillus macquariensis]MEC0092504.1 phage tail protein [Paenibacillus macquariensis]OAB35462.1 hypothetical protein PMSM_09405 [Paenibacillus macquariensis subsp. macquariensis]SIR35271.1 hypothetical protein SAMN05421578_111162 [Paenibacillus macquariensis]
MTKYRTIQGDTWDGVAFKISGTESFMTTLMDANPDFIGTIIFSSGNILNVPEVVVDTADTLPPWRMGE